MKVKFRKSETQKEHEVLTETPNYYILATQPINWSSNCYIAVLKAAVDVVEDVTYKVGQKFKLGDRDNDEYLLANVGVYGVMFVNIKSGWHWRPPIIVKDASKITQKELGELAHPYHFRRIS